MDVRDIVELVTLLGGVAVSVAGAISQIRQRREGDEALAEQAGADVVARARATTDITAPDRTYLEQVHTHVATVEGDLNRSEARLAAARKLLRQYGVPDDILANLGDAGEA